jgi:hypothetical protein
MRRSERFQVSDFRIELFAIQYLASAGLKTLLPETAIKSCEIPKKPQNIEQGM